MRGASERRMGRSEIIVSNHITRHAFGKPARTYQEVYPLCSLRQKHGRLAGGVASADDNHFFSHAQLRLHECGSIVDAVSFELRQIIDGQPAVPSAGRDNDGARGNRPTVVSINRVWFSIAR